MSKHPMAWPLAFLVLTSLSLCLS
uniref:Uncharacterized protein n=1 Tax=Anguilla anguilla TaxID=7936 RepID=A0A0E9W116_ANGAN